MWTFSVLGFLGVLFAFLLHEREVGPHGSRLEARSYFSHLADLFSRNAAIPSRASAVEINSSR